MSKDDIIYKGVEIIEPGQQETGNNRSGCMTYIEYRPECAHCRTEMLFLADVGNESCRRRGHKGFPKTESDCCNNQQIEVQI